MEILILRYTLLSLRVYRVDSDPANTNVCAFCVPLW